MKKILLIVILLFAISISVNAFDFSKLLFESAIETDRFQSYNWHFATKNNPVISPTGYKVWEENPFIAGTNREFFNKKVNIAKDYVNTIKNRYIYLAITFVEIYNVVQNNKASEIQGYPQIWTISYSWEF